MTAPVKSAADLKGKRGLRRLLNATRYSWQGLRAAFQNEAAFREECLCAVVLIPVAFFLPISVLEKLVLVQSILFVLLTEILNSAIEAAVDRFGPEIHPLVGRAKDMGSAAVMIALAAAALSWILITGPILFAILD